MPKLVYKDIIRSSEALCPTSAHGLYGNWFQKHFNIFSPENVYRSTFTQGDGNNLFVHNGTFGFTRLLDLSPTEVAFLATGSFMEKLLFSVMRLDRQFMDGDLDLLTEDNDDSAHHNFLEKRKVRAVTRMLLMPSRSETNLMRRILATGPPDAPFEALVNTHHDRLLSNIKLLHSTYTNIPRTRAPPVCTGL